MNLFSILLAEAGVPGTFLLNLLIGILLGTMGQMARAAVGIKKENDVKAPGESLGQVIDVSQLTLSLMYGAVAGGLAALLMGSDKMNAISTDESIWLALFGAGYSGSDFLEGIISKAKGHSQKLLDSASESSGKIEDLP